MTVPTVLTGVDELVRDRADGRDVRVLDVRWSLAEPNGRPAYRAGHIPGAVYVDLETELARLPGPGEGRHPLPHLADLQAAARSWGIDDGDPVVVYDDSQNLAAARAWWLLSHAGLRGQRPGRGARSLAGRRAGAGHRRRAGRARLGHPRVRRSAGARRSRTWRRSWPPRPLLDARAGERYRGEHEPIDPRAGHIPGALSAPTTENLDAAGRFLPPAALRERFAGLGLEPGAPGRRLLRLRGHRGPRGGRADPRGLPAGALPGVVVGVVVAPRPAGRDGLTPQLRPAVSAPPESSHDGSRQRGIKSLFEPLHLWTGKAP